MQIFYFINKKLLLYIMQYIPQNFLVRNISAFFVNAIYFFREK